MATNKSIALGSSLTAAAGIIFRDTIAGVISTIRTFRLGITGSLDGLSWFLEYGLIAGLYKLAGDTMLAAFHAHGRWLADTFGVAAQPVAIGEAILIVWVLGSVAVYGLKSFIPGVA